MRQQLHRVCDARKDEDGHLVEGDDRVGSLREQLHSGGEVPDRHRRRRPEQHDQDGGRDARQSEVRAQTDRDRDDHRRVDRTPDEAPLHEPERQRTPRHRLGEQRLEPALLHRQLELVAQAAQASREEARGDQADDHERVVVAADVDARRLHDLGDEVVREDRRQARDLVDDERERIAHGRQVAHLHERG